MNFLAYFQAYQNYFWDWEEDEHNLIITSGNGMSIAYAPFLFEIFEGLSTAGAPPFGSLVMSLMATDESPTRFLDYLQHELHEMEAESAHAKKSIYYASKALKMLHTFAAMPPEYKKGDKRILMFATVFSKTHNGINAKRVAHFSRIFKENDDILYHCLDQIPFSHSNFTKDIKALALLSDEFPTTKSILDAILGAPVDEYNDSLQDEIQEFKDSDNPFELVEKLIAGNETFYVGSLIRRLWSGLNINMRHRSPSEQPLDGISDITNKGEVSRLLLSEFAHDEDVFVQRIANHEALYILREVPPESNQLDRVFLLDSSIKCWGNVRTINLAIAFAIAKHPKTDIHSKIYALSNLYKEIFLDNIHDIINGLNVLSPNLDCISGIESYLENEYQKNQEIFFITSADQLQNVDIQNILKTHQDKIGYVIFTNEKGEIKIFKQLKSGKKHVQDLKLNLDQLWMRNPQPVKIQRTKHVGQIPMLYPSQKNYTIFKIDDQFYKISNHVLYKFHQSTNKGFELITQLPEYSYDRKNSLLYKNEYKELVVVCHDPQQNELVFNNLATHKITKLTFTISAVGHEFYLNGTQPTLIINEQTSFEISERDVTLIKTRKRESDYHVLQNFIATYRNTRLKMTILNKINYSVSIIETNTLSIDRFFFGRESFYLYGQKVETHPFQCFGDLILKRTGSNAKEAINCLIHKLGIEQSAAQKIIADGAGLSRYDLVISSDNTKEKLEFYKEELEKTGCVCYIITKNYQSADGSQILLENGILTLISSDASIPNIYIAYVADCKTAMCTEDFFAGNPYFLPENSNLKVIDVDTFYDNFVQPFTYNIVKHGVNA